MAKELIKKLGDIVDALSDINDNMPFSPDDELIDVICTEMIMSLNEIRDSINNNSDVVGLLRYDLQAICKILEDKYKHRPAQIVKLNPKKDDK
tara:strand:+ start:299 stop:577 length:279 start_codon:yes stop_codon:yes gene_type:complete